MTPQELENLAHLRRARDLIDRDYAKPLDVPTMATKALMSPAHFSRQFRAAYGETPTEYRKKQHDAVNAMPSRMAMERTCPVRRKSSGKKSSRIEEATGGSAA